MDSRVRKELSWPAAGSPVLSSEADTHEEAGAKRAASDAGVQPPPSGEMCDGLDDHREAQSPGSSRFVATSSRVTPPVGQKPKASLPFELWMRVAEDINGTGSSRRNPIGSFRSASKMFHAAANLQKTRDMIASGFVRAFVPGKETTVPPFIGSLLNGARELDLCLSSANMNLRRLQRLRLFSDQLPRIEFLNLENNMLGSVFAKTEIVDAVASFSNLKTLHLANNTMDADDFRWVADIIQRLPGLTDLDLSRNSLTGEASEFISFLNTAQAHPQLKALHLQFFSLSRPAVERVRAYVGQGNCKEFVKTALEKMLETHHIDISDYLLMQQEETVFLRNRLLRRLPRNVQMTHELLVGELGELEELLRRLR